MIDKISPHSPVSKQPINSLIDIANNQTKTAGLVTIGHNVSTPQNFTKNKNARSDEFLRIIPYVKDGTQLCKMKLGSQNMAMQNINPQIVEIYEIWQEEEGANLEERALLEHIDDYGFVETHLRWKQNQIQGVYATSNEGNIFIVTDIDVESEEENLKVLFPGLQIKRRYILLDYFYDTRFDLKWQPVQGHVGVIDLGSNEIDLTCEWLAQLSTDTTASTPTHKWVIYLGENSSGASGWSSLTLGGNPVAINGVQSINGKSCLVADADQNPELWGHVSLDANVPTFGFSDHPGINNYPDSNYFFIAKYLGEDKVWNGTAGKVSLDAPLVDACMLSSYSSENTRSIEYVGGVKRLQLYNFQETANSITFVPSISGGPQEFPRETDSETSTDLSTSIDFVVRTSQDNASEVAYQKIYFDWSTVQDEISGLVTEAVAEGLEGGGDMILSVLSDEISGMFWNTGENLEPNSTSATCKGNCINDINDRTKISLLSCALYDDWTVPNFTVQNSLSVNQKFSAISNTFVLSDYEGETRLNWQLKPQTNGRVEAVGDVIYVKNVSTVHQDTQNSMDDDGFLGGTSPVSIWDADNRGIDIFPDRILMGDNAKLVWFGSGGGDDIELTKQDVINLKALLPLSGLISGGRLSTLIALADQSNT